MIVKLAAKKLTYTQQSLMHRETGVQFGDEIPKDVLKHYQRDNDKNLYYNTHGLKKRLEKAKKADEWTDTIRKLP